MEVGRETQGAQVIKPDGKKGRQREGQPVNVGRHPGRTDSKANAGGFGNYRELDGVS